MSLWSPSKAFLVFALVSVAGLPRSLAHKIERRQIGVLARTGALPQGKRSVEVLARNGELPHQSKKEQDDNDFTLDLLIRELETAESISRLRVQALAERMLEERDPEPNGETQKRSVAVLARNGELPQKRSSEAATRSGYLVRPPPETVRPPPDPFDPDDFLAEGQPSGSPDYSDEGPAELFFLRPEKRSLGPARNFLLATGKAVESGTHSQGKRNLGSLARDGGLSTLKHHAMKERRADDALGAPDLLDDYGKAADASRNLIKREIRGTCWNEYRRRGDGDKAWGPEPRDEGAPPEKRFLGRIPQLGRTHQKVQSPSARRRPHLRPNWL